MTLFKQNEQFQNKHIMWRHQNQLLNTASRTLYFFSQMYAGFVNEITICGLLVWAILLTLFRFSLPQIVNGFRNLQSVSLCMCFYEGCAQDCLLITTVYISCYCFSFPLVPQTEGQSSYCPLLPQGHSPYYTLEAGVGEGAGRWQV